MELLDVTDAVVAVDGCGHEWRQLPALSIVVDDAFLDVCINSAPNFVNNPRERRSAMNEAAIVPHICFRQKPSVLAYILFSPSKNLSANVGLSEIERLRKREAIIGT